MQTSPFDESEFLPQNSQYYKKKLIKDVQPDDEMIQVVGKASNINASQEFILSDESGKLQIRDIPDNFERIVKDEVYRVFGKLSVDPIGTHYLGAEIVQKLSTLNLDHYRKALELSKKIK